MLDSIVFKKFTDYLNLIRFNKPIGFLLLMWPCWFGLSLLDLEINSLIFWLVLFLLGSFLMRSAGCIINDIIDRDIDTKVVRTSLRPIASKQISLFEAILFLTILLLISLIILLQFSYAAIICGLLSLPLIFIYPYMKRVTYWPQIILGIVFSWGVLIVAIQFEHTSMLEFIFLYIGCVFWTVGYDTIYAYQDRKDDIKLGIKSTAVYFGKNGRLFIFFCYSLALFIFGYLGWFSSKSLISLITIAMIAICTYIAILKWDMHSQESSNFYFRQNNFFGIMLFTYLLVF